MRYYLDDREVDPPLNADGLTLRKSLDKVFSGFLLRKLGYIEGVGDLRFEQPDAVRLLKQKLHNKGIQAQTRFRIVVESGEVAYDGFIDYATFSWDGRAVSVGLRDEKAAFDLQAQSATSYSLLPTTTLSLHARRLGGVVQLLTDPNTLVLSRTTKDAATLNHSVPLTRKSEKDDTVSGTLVPVVTPLALDPFYRNTTGDVQFIKLSGLVAVTATASASLTVRLLATSLTAGGEVANQVEVGQYGIGSSPTLIRTLLDLRIGVPQNGSLRLWWETPTNVLTWAFTYVTPGEPNATLVSVTDELTLQGSFATGLLTIDVLAGLVKRASDGALSVRSRFFESGEGSGFILLNGANLRGVNKPITTDLQTVFQGLTTIFNLSLWVDGAAVWIEPTDDAPRRKTTVRQAFSYRRQVATEYLYSQVQAGYAVWQGQSLLSGEETCGSRSYTTGITTRRNTLDIRSILIASSTLIEEQRRKAGDPKAGGDGKADNLDDALFIVAAVRSGTGWKAQTNYDATGVADAATLYNVPISPARNLDRWKNRLTGSGPLSLESVQGSAELKSNYGRKVINEKGAPTLINKLPWLDTLDVPMSLAEFALLGERIVLAIPGITGEGELLDATWRKSDEGDTATLILLNYNE